MSTWFTSDLHFGHGNIIKYCNRPFLTPADEEALKVNGGQWNNGGWRNETASPHRITAEAIEIMDEHLIGQINNRVKSTDDLWILGDFCLAGKRDVYDKVAYYRHRINCKNVKMVWGNHDSHKSEIAGLFTASYDYIKIRVEGQVIILSHYAHCVWDQSHRGAWQLYGHSHSGSESWMDSNMPGRRSLDVGVDNAKKLLGDYRPFSFNELQEIMSERNGFSMDHHVPTNFQGPSEEELIDGLPRD